MGNVGCCGADNKSCIYNKISQLKRNKQKLSIDIERKRTKKHQTAVNIVAGDELTLIILNGYVNKHCKLQFPPDLMRILCFYCTALHFCHPQTVLKFNTRLQDTYVDLIDFNINQSTLKITASRHKATSYVRESIHIDVQFVTISSNIECITLFCRWNLQYKVPNCDRNCNKIIKKVIKVYKHKCTCLYRFEKNYWNKWDIDTNGIAFKMSIDVLGISCNKIEHHNDHKLQTMDKIISYNWTFASYYNTFS
eukprot:336439_1